MRSFFCFLLLLIIIIVAACDNNVDNSNTMYTAEMATFLTDADTMVQTGTLDDDRRIVLSKKIKMHSAKPNESYRMMLYYTKTSESSNTVSADFVSANVALVPQIHLADTMKIAVKNDPIELRSAWESKNGKFFNIYLGLRTASSSSMMTQTVGFVCDSVKNDTTYIRLVHDQNGVLQYYTIGAFMCLKRDDVVRIAGGNPNATAKIVVPTYDGTYNVKAFVKKQSVEAN